MDIGMMDKEQFEAWSRSRPSFVLINRDINPNPTAADLSPELIERLNGARPGFLVVTREELGTHGIMLAHDQLARFQRGEPVLLVVGRVDHRAQLKRGRRSKEELERAVQDALAVQTYLGVERLCGWQKARDGRRVTLTVPELRDRVLDQLATVAWLDDPNTIGGKTESERQSFFRTQYDAGGRLIATWFSWAERPDDLSREARQVVEESARKRPTLIAEEIVREIRMIGFMVRCLRQATTLVLAAHEMSAEIRKHDKMTNGQQAVLAGAISDRSTLFEATRAALDGDFNPADLFPSLLSYYNTLELACLLGRRRRGHDIHLEPDLLREMQRQILLREMFDADQLQHPGGMPFDEQAAALVLTQAAYESIPKSRWPGLLDEAIKLERAVTLSVSR